MHVEQSVPANLQVEQSVLAAPQVGQSCLAVFQVVSMQHGVGEVFANTQLDEALQRLRSSPSSMTLFLYYSLPNQPGHVCPAEF